MGTSCRGDFDCLSEGGGEGSDGLQDCLWLILEVGFGIVP